MNIKEILLEATNILRESEIEAPAQEAGAIISFVLNKDISYIYTYYEKEINQKDYNNIINFVVKRSRHIPMQHLTGKQEFMSLEFNVNNNVLIPRPETELLVEKIISIYNQKESPMSILDIGTGSGCISVSIAYYLKNVDITAVDISEEALTMALHNAKKHNLNSKIKFLKLDILKEIPNKTYDLIVSNPPYIKEKDILTLQEEVRLHDPTIALDGGKDGLLFYNRILSISNHILKKGGKLLFECGYDQAKDITRMFELYNYKNIEIIKDYSGVERIVIGQI